MLGNTWIPIEYLDTNFVGQRFHTHQAAHFNLLWPNEIHIIRVMEEFETGAAFTLQGPAFPPGAMYGNSVELDMNWIWCSETETGFRVLAHVAKFGTDSHILFHDFHATSCHKTLQAVVSLWANWAKWIRVAELGDNAQRWGINANPIECHQVLMLYLAGPLEPKPETCERFWGGTTRLVTGRVSLSVPNRIIHRIDTDSDPMYVCYIALSIYIYIYIWWCMMI